MNKFLETMSAPTEVEAELPVDPAAPVIDATAPELPAGFTPREKKKQFKRDKRDVHGWLVLDKPVGMTSTHAVSVIKRLFTAKRAGHAGTLDPLASGCLPIALGEATKTVPFVMDGRKLYRFTICWGEERDTDDTEGKAIANSDLRPTPEAIRALLPAYIGTIQQVPPKYSAIKIEGERAYDLARDGETVELVARPVQIDRWSWLTSRTPITRSWRPNAEREPTSGRWPAIWAGPWAVSAMSAPCGAPRSGPSSKKP